MPSGAGLALLLGAAAAHAVEFKPRLEAEERWFWQADGSGTELLSVAASVEAFQGWDGDRQRIVAELFGRMDTNDVARSHGDLRELNYQVIGDDFEFRLGLRRVYWGVTESRHLVDIVNQSDFVENIDGEDKLGQPMMNLALIRAFGTVDLFLLPYQRARTFPGDEGYPQLPLPLHAWEAQYQSRRAQKHLDYALRYVNAFGPLDIGVAWFDGTAREPRLVPCIRRNASGTFLQGSPDGPICDDFASAFVAPPPLPPPPPPEVIAQQFAAEVRANLVLVPHYDRLKQASVDAQYVVGSLALKVEALHRQQQDRGTWAAVTGFEYTLGDLWGSGADVGLLAEYLYDEKKEFLGVLTDDEVFAGTRLAFSDVAGTQLLAGVIANRENFRSRLYGIEASRRLGDDWKLSLETRIFSRLPANLLESFLADQDFVTFTLERFF